MKKILIDANPAVPYLVTGRVNGIGRTNIELIKALDQISPSELPFNIELYTQNLKGVSAKGLGTSFKTHHAFLRNIPSWNIKAAKFRIREIMTHYDLMHITHNFEYVAHPEKCILTIHDAMMFTYPEQFLGHDYMRDVYPELARKVRAIITCSENSKREIAEYMDVNPDKIFVAPWGVDHDVLRSHKVGTNKYCGKNPYFISVSCDIGRKNTIAVVKAYIEFAKNKPNHHLILVWRKPSDEVLRTQEENSEISEKIHFASNISNEELSDLYAGASCSFFPSRYEGFGLPIAESMACGTQVVTCRNSSLPEVGGDVAIYVDPDDIGAMAHVMEKFENEEYSRDLFQSDCLSQSKKFTWEKCARNTLSVYEKCLL